MVEKEFNLSEKIIEGKVIKGLISQENVKEFIRRAKKILENSIDSGCDEEYVLRKFDELAGEKLK